MELNENVFHRGDVVIILDAIKVETDAGRNPRRDCMSPASRMAYREQIGVVLKQSEDAVYRGVHRNIYEVKMNDGVVEDFHPEWMEKLCSESEMNKAFEHFISAYC